jgi:hypothetical protein
MKKFWKILLIIVGVGVIIFVLIQLLPIGKDHANPAVASEPNWDSPATRQLAKRACFDCHSNETVWPWYSKVAPASWLVYFDVVEGRRRLNFSDWNAGFHPNAGEITGMIQEGEMPPFQYLIMHPEARLTSAEKQALIDGLSGSLR